MAPTQIYVTGLFGSVTIEDLQCMLKPFGFVENIDIKVKTNTQGDEYRTYAVVDIDADDKNLVKCFTAYNNTLWKGKKISVSRAKDTKSSKKKIKIGQLAFENTSNQEKLYHRKDRTDEEDEKDLATYSSNEIPISNKRLKMFPQYKDHRYQPVDFDNQTNKKEALTAEDDFEVTPAREGVPMFKGISMVTSVKSELADLSTSSFDKPVKYSREMQAVVNNKVKKLSFQTSTPKYREEQISNDFNNRQGHSKHQVDDPIPFPNSKSPALSRLECFSSVWRDGENENGTVEYCSDLSNSSFREELASNEKAQSLTVSKKRRDTAVDYFETDDEEKYVPREKLMVNKSKKKNKQRTHDFSVETSELPNDTPLDSAPHIKISNEEQTSKRKIQGKSEAERVADNAKRLRSVKEKQTAMKSQKKTIQNALDFANSNRNMNKKIVFDAEDGNIMDNREENNKSYKTKTNRPEISCESQPKQDLKKTPLFDEEEEFSQQDIDVFKNKKQFEGIAGRKLFELQSNFGADERFKLDDRFVNDLDEEDISEEGYDYEVDEPGEETNLKKETLRSLDILKSVVPEKRQKQKRQKIPEMITYDASNPEHSIRIEKVDKKSKAVAEPESIEEKEISIPIVSQECFYEVDPSLEATLEKNSSSKKQSFSLLNMFNKMRKIGLEEEENFVKEDKHETKEIKEKIRNPLMYDSSDAEETDYQKIKKNKFDHNKNTSDEQNKKSQTFFFFPGDLRLKEGVKFFHKKKDLHIDYKNWRDVRNKLKQNIQLQVKRATQRRRSNRRQFQKKRKWE